MYASGRAIGLCALGAIVCDPNYADLFREHSRDCLRRQAPKFRQLLYSVMFFQRDIPISNSQSPFSAYISVVAKGSALSLAAIRIFQSIRFLLIENGSYSNPACYFFSRCSRRLLNGSSGGTAGGPGSELPVSRDRGGTVVDCCRRRLSLEI